MKAWWRRVRPNVLPFPIYCLVRLIGMTLKIQIEGFEPYKNMPGGKIYAGWHGRTLLAALFFRGQGVWTIISQSKDGEMQNRIFKKFGFKTIRGSTGRGGAQAAIESINVLKEGNSMAFPPDGPRGPSGIVQPGIMLMARKSGAVLVPVGVSANRRWLIPAWDKYMIPKPFAKGIMIFGEGKTVPPKATPEEIEEIRLWLESEMHRLEQLAEQKMGHDGK